jgi:hypothetical protein
VKIPFRIRALSVLLGVTLSAAPRAAIIDRVFAVVNGAILTQSDVYGAMAMGIVNTSGAPDPIASALEQLIERELILAEVDRYGPPEPPEAEIAERIARVRSRFPSADAFARALATTGFDEERLRAITRDEVRIEMYLNQRFGASVSPGDRASVIAEWTAGLRGRADVTIQYLTPR